MIGIGEAFSLATTLFKGALEWFGLYKQPDAVRARQMRLQQIEQMKFDELQALADKGDVDAQNEVRKRMANNGTTNK